MAKSAAQKKTASGSPLPEGAHERSRMVLELLTRRYPHPATYLHHETPWQLLVATALSAQCTDDRVNMVTPDLFRRWPGPAEMAAAPLGEVEDAIRRGAAGHRSVRRRAPENHRRAHDTPRRCPQDCQYRALERLWHQRRYSRGHARQTDHAQAGADFTDGSRQGGAGSHAALSPERMGRHQPQARALRARGLHGAFAKMRRMRDELLLPEAGAAAHKKIKQDKIGLRNHTAPEAFGPEEKFLSPR